MNQIYKTTLVSMITLLLSCSEGSFTSDNSKSSSKGGSGSNGDGLEGGADAGGGANAGNDHVGVGGMSGDGIAAIGDVTTNEFITKLNNANDVLSLCQQFQKQTAKQRIDFPGTSKECAWGTDGNLPIKPGYAAARYENTKDLSLPKDAVICSMKLDFPSQNIEYDDFLFFMFGDYILLSSVNMTNRVDWQTRDGLDIYSWDTLKGFKDDLAFRYDPPYCIDGPGSCSVPNTETTGEIKLTITDSRMQALTASLAKNHFYQFKVVVVGDKNTTDCQHATIAFDTDVTYVIPK